MAETATGSAPETLPRAWGEPPVCAVVRDRPEDFVVRELPLIEPDDEGQHLLLHVRKRERTTEQVGAALARVAGVPRRAVSWAGLKDRQAITEQWFSLDLAGKPAPEFPPDEGYEVLAVHRHGRKLRPGTLAGNHFRLTLRQVRGERGALEQRMAAIAAGGVPDYFGAQRFGRGGGNVARARAMFSGTIRIRDRHQRGLMLSAARSELFNRVLGERVAAGDWNRALPGDALQWQGSHSRFQWDGSEAGRIHAAVQALDLHPTGPLWGRGETGVGEDIAARERAAIAGNEDLATGLEQAGMSMDRRALRMAVKDWQAEYEGDRLVLEFSLPPGGYATAVLREIVLSD